MSGGRNARGCEAPREDWEEYVRANAVAVADDLRAKVARLRAEVTRLAKKVRGLQTGRDRLRAVLRAVIETWPESACDPAMWPAVVRCREELRRGGLKP